MSNSSFGNGIHSPAIPPAAIPDNSAGLRPAVYPLTTAAPAPYMAIAATPGFAVQSFGTTAGIPAQGVSSEILAASPVSAPLVKLESLPVPPAPLKDQSFGLPISPNARLDGLPAHLKRHIAGRASLIVYVPNNGAIYNAAINGFLAGVHDSVWLTDASSVDDNAIVTAAQILAEAIDRAIPAGTITQAHESFIEGICSSSFVNRYTLDPHVADYSNLAAAIVALYTVASSAFAYVPPPGGGGWTTYTQDLTGLSGVVLYSGPATIPNQIFLTGAPASIVSYQMPATPFVTQFYATSVGGVNIGTPTSGYLVPGVPTSRLVYSDGGLAVGLCYYSGMVGDILVDIGAYNTLTVNTIGWSNIFGPGSIPMVPIYGAALNPQDAAAFGVTPTPDYTGPTFAFQDALVEYNRPPNLITPSLAYGWEGNDSSGTSETLIPVAYYPNAPWVAQGQGRTIARDGDSIIGPLTQSIHYWTIPDSVNGTVTSFEFCVSAKVNSVGAPPGTVVVGDTYYATGVITAKSIGGVVSVVGVTLPAVVVADASMADIAVVASVVGSDIAISVTSGAQPGVADVIAYQTFIEAEVC